MPSNTLLVLTSSAEHSDTVIAYRQQKLSSSRLDSQGSDARKHEFPCCHAAEPWPVYIGATFVTASPFSSSMEMFFGAANTYRAARRMTIAVASEAYIQQRRAVYFMQTPSKKKQAVDKMRVGERGTAARGRH